MSKTRKLRAAGIIRVSEKKGREGDSFASPDEQRERIEAECARENIDLLWDEDEIDVKGETPLAKRRHLLRGIEEVEAGQLDVIVVAYFDRLVRKLAIQAEIISRVHAAGGKILAVGFGEIGERSAAEWLSATIIGAMNEFVTRQARERGAEAQARAVARGVPPWPNLPPGVRRIDVPKGHPDHGKVEADPATIGHVIEALELRDGGATIAAVRTFLGDYGVKRSYHGVQQMLSDRLYLGEIHFGDLVNLHAFDPLVPRPLFNRVQRVKVARGRRAKSERLLARLGILRCENCGAAMCVGTQKQNGRSYAFYRCPPTGDCDKRVTIGAEIAEKVVVDHARAALADAEGRASVEDNARQAEAAAEKAQADLDAAIRAFAGVQDEPAAADRLAELQAARDLARDRVDHLGGTRARVVVNGAADWDRLSLDGRRALLRATVDSASVGPVAGAATPADRVAVQLVSE